MNTMLQQWAMGLIVLAALLYVAWRWLPARARRRLGRVHPALGQGPGGCGSGGAGCSSCGGCAGKAKRGG